MKNKIVVIFSSQLSNDENNKFIEHIKNTIGCNHKIYYYNNYNQYSLSYIYNHAIHTKYEDDCIFVMCHNDIYFKTKNWGKILLNKFNNSNYDIIGVAGSTYLPESGVWWEDRSKMIGIVEHTNGYKTWISEYSLEKKGCISPVVLVDGLFISFNPDTIIHKFDEDFNGFHFYDLSFCIPNYLDGCNIGVTTDIRILHNSIGTVNKEWDINRKKFVEKYYDELPIYYCQDNKENNDIMINIITRTHNRPDLFKKCRESIVNQTHKNINHIVGSDIDCNYYDNTIFLKLKDVEYPRLMPEYNTYPAPWNLHLNELANYVKYGWVMYLDDDDMFSHKKSLEIIINHIENEDELLIWKVNIKINENGWIVPNDNDFGKRINAGNVSGIGIMFHTKHLPVDWGSWSYGDYRVVKQLLNKKLKIKWINYVLTETQGKPNNGK